LCRIDPDPEPPVYLVGQEVFVWYVQTGMAYDLVGLERPFSYLAGIDTGAQASVPDGLLEHDASYKHVEFMRFVAKAPGRATIRGANGLPGLQATIDIVSDNGDFSFGSYNWPDKGIAVGSGDGGKVALYYGDRMVCPSAAMFSIENETPDLCTVESRHTLSFPYTPYRGVRVTGLAHGVCTFHILDFRGVTQETRSIPILEAP
jgi:hypothetical protein